MSARNQLKNVSIYIDGSCNPVGKIGGWGAILQYKHHEKLLRGSVAKTTIAKMELTSAIEALSALKYPCNVTITLDSQYVQNGMTLWIAGWKKNNWKSTTGEEIKNVELWQQLDNVVATSGHKITWILLKSKASDSMLKRVQILAKQGLV